MTQKEEDGFDVKMFKWEDDFVQIDAGSELNSSVEIFEDKVDAEG